MQWIAEYNGREGCGWVCYANLVRVLAAPQDAPLSGLGNGLGCNAISKNWRTARAFWIMCVYIITWLKKSTTSLSDPSAIHNQSNTKQHISSWSKWSLDTWIPSVQFLDLQQFADRCLPPKDAMTPNCIRALCLRGIQWEQAQGRIQYCNRKEYLLEAASSPTVCGEGSPLVPPIRTLEISDILFAIAINKRKKI